MTTKYGQNFLTDKNIAKNIVEAAKITPQDIVVEIGPGKGIITEFVAKKTDKLIAVEIDRNLIDDLKSKFPKAHIIHADALELNYEKILDEKKAIFVGNLPYYISTAIVKKIIPLNCWIRAIFTFQKEVAERITAVPSKKKPRNYGFLSVLVSYYANSKILFDIPPEAFCPSPKVVSSVVELSPIKEDKVDSVSTELFLKIVEIAFSQRRKTILNNLSNLIKDKAVVKKILNLSGIQPDTRPEKIGLTEYKKLTEVFSNFYHNLI